MRSLVPNFQKERARSYCRSIGLDPDEIIYGYAEFGVWTCGQRWVWYAR
jgi:hypothetical protein